MLAGDFLRLLRKLSKDSSRIGIYASSYVKHEGNKATIYWRDEVVCAVEKNEVPAATVYEGSKIVARGVLDTLEIVAAKGALKSNWRSVAHKELGPGYGF